MKKIDEGLMRMDPEEMTPEQYAEALLQIAAAAKRHRAARKEKEDGK